jgi:ADP-heptose:LPS heptosyltransferase
MFILSFSDFFSLTLSQAHGNHLFTCEPHKAYLFSEFIFDEIRKNPIPPPLDKVSLADPVLKTFNVAQFPPPRDLLFYMGVGGMGDNIMSWGVVRHLAERGYRMHVLCLPIMEFCWQGFPWVESLVFLPTYWSLINRFDHHLMFEAISNSYTHDQQSHPIDAMLEKVGIDPSTVPPDRKRVAPIFSRQEERVAQAMYPGKKLAFFQLSPSQQARQVPPALSREILQGLAAAFPEFHWIALGGGTTKAAYFEPPIPLPNIEYRTFDRIRILWALIRRAELCVSPDTMLVHAAGMFGVPCVGLWGTYPPASRVAYYENHHALFRRELCPRSPCNWNADGLPNFCPPESGGQPRTHCAVLAGLTAEDVVATARRALAERR